MPFDDVFDGIRHPGPPPFGHIREFGPIYQDRPGFWRPRKIDSLGPIRLRPQLRGRPRAETERFGEPLWEPGQGPHEV